jgi:MFS family permease
MASNLRDALVGYGVQDHQLTPKQRWLCFSALFFCGFVACYTCFKGGAILPQLAVAFQLNSSQQGLVMSSFALVGLVCAYLGTWIMRNIGIKFSVMLTIAISILGSASGLFAHDANAFLVTRALEGAGFGLISTIGPNIMPRLFPLKNQGLVMGIWSQWVPVGSVLSFTFAPLLITNPATGEGWQAVWIISLVLEIIVAVCLLVLVKMPAVAENTIVSGDVSRKKVFNKTFWKSALAISLIFFCWVLVYLSCINQFYPTFLQGGDAALALSSYAMSPAESNLPPNIIALITIPLGILVGVLADKTNTRKVLLSVAWAVAVLSVGFIAFNETIPGAPYIFAVLMGLCAACIPTMTRSIIPLLAQEPTKTDYCLATMAFVTSVAQVGAFFIGTSISTLGWQGNAAFVCAPVLLAALVVTLFCKNDRKALDEISLDEVACGEKETQAMGVAPAACDPISLRS